MEGHYEFVEVSAPAGMDCDKTPVGVHVNAEDIQGEQTIVVTKVNHHKRSLTISKRDAESGDPIPNTSFHIRGINVAYENDVVTGADGRAVLESMPSGCYEITETDVPSPWLLDANNRKTVWIDAKQDKAVSNAIKGRLIPDDDQHTLAVALLSGRSEADICHITLLDLADAADFFAFHSGDYGVKYFYSGGWA